MDELSLGLIIAFSKPVLFVLALALASLAVLAIFIADPKWPTLALVLVILNFVNPSYGFLGAAPTNIYEWKPSQIPFPLIQFYLYGLFLAVLLRNAFSGVHPLRQAGGIWLLLFALMFLGHIFAGLTDDKTSWGFLFHGLGLIHVLHMGMLMYIVASVLDNEKNLNAFIKIFLAVALGRAIFGLGRFLLFGGDPQNGYATLGGGGFKITYWDLSEGLIASMAAFYFAYRLVNGRVKLISSHRWFFIIALALELSVIVLSFRRTNLFGLILVAIYFLSLLPWRKSVVYAAVGAALILPPVLGVAAYRAQETFGSQKVDLWEAISQEKTGKEKIGERGDRFYELQVAFRNVEDNPVLGIGSWNAFKIGPGDAISLAYHQGNFHFIHSGFGHVLLKSGLLGLTLFVGILLAAWRYAGKARRFVPPKYRALFESYRAGLWFMAPTLAFGTPIIEMRTMMWLAMVLAVPIAVARFSQAKQVPLRTPAGISAIAQPA